MENKHKYKRYFLIFEKVDEGFGDGKDPSGHLKIEVNGDTGKLAAVVQNLNNSRGDSIYKLYLLKCGKGKLEYAYAGTIPFQRGRGEFNLSFEPSNIAGTGIDIEKFNMSVIIAESDNGFTGVLKCPLAAYREKRYEWRDELQKELYPAKESRTETVRQKAKDGETADIFSKFLGRIDSKYKADEPLPEKDSIKADNTMEENEPVIGMEKIYEKPAEIDNLLEKSCSPAEAECIEKPIVENNTPVQTEEELGISSVEDNLCGNEQNEKMSGECQKSIQNTNPDTNYCDLCLNCSLGKQRDGSSSVTGNGQGSIERLKLSLNKCFEAFNPFGTRKSNYKWWKVSSPVYLNNILYHCSIKSPLLFNPRVLMAHFKYRHLIFGTFNDLMRKREYLVCGVPGVYGLDEKPFGEMCRWVQLEGYKPKYGAFGYWLVYMEPQTGKLLKTN